MKFCQNHWGNLRAAIEDRGLSVLVAESGQDAATKMRRQIEGEDSIDSFEPLLSAHNAIAANVMRLISEGGGNPLYLLTVGPEDPVEGHEGKTWPRCPLCYLNLAHELGCEGCDLPQETGYDWMITRAADDALEHWKALRP